MTTSGTPSLSPVQHGGNLHNAIARYGIPRADWLDISTGISPFPWPVPIVPSDVWQRLPEQDGALEQAARQYYGTDALAVPGSQWAIQQLPALFSRRRGATRVWLPQECYEEYRYWWQFHGHVLQHYAALPTQEQLQERDIVIVLNPNNPSAHYHAVTELQALAQRLQPLDGFLILDEAFMDATPTQSLLPHINADTNVILLRSLGKFFGLAGIRTGFVCGNRKVQEELRRVLGPWAISHPAQWIAIQALQDESWQHAMRQLLPAQSQRLANLLARHFPADCISATPLFVTVSLTPESLTHWQDQLARHGIWTRCFMQWGKLRFGLADDAGLARLEQALERCAADE
ncbi:MAG: threonine-phosphate decarboxylase [Gammaproteobacteria bacterium]|nr:threonine-phosphate decarboxylase [Gammaproteobacteria bacterium]